MALGTVFTSQSLPPTDRMLGLFSSLQRIIIIFFLLKSLWICWRNTFFLNGMGFGFSGTEYDIQS